MVARYSDYRSKEYADKMQAYLDNLKKFIAADPQAAAEKARASLIRSGIMDEKTGHIKEKIVSYE